MLDAENRQNVLNRLKRIAGQVSGIQKMVEDDRYCVDVLLQLAAVQVALRRVGRIMLESHVRTCVSTALTSGDERERDEKIAELIKVFNRYDLVGK